MKRLSFPLFVVIFASSGCSLFKQAKSSSWDDKTAKKDDGSVGTPVRMVVTWTDGTYTQPGYPPTRGFAGRVHFYDEEYQAIEVDGQLAVYGFDDSNKQSVRKSADKEFVYKPEHLKRRMSESQLGPSYNIWIPWDAVGGAQKDISLVPVFRSSNGQLVRGDQSLNVLPGPKANGIFQNEIAGPSGQIQQVSHVGAVPAGSGNSLGAPYSPRNTGLRTTTINVPPGTRRHLQAPLRPRGEMVVPAGAQSNSDVRQTNAHLNQLQSEWERLRANGLREQQLRQTELPENTNRSTAAPGSAAIQGRYPQNFLTNRQSPHSIGYSPQIRPVRALPGVRRVDGHDPSQPSP